MTLTGQQFQIRSGAHEATVVEVGAGLRHYAVEGRDVTLRYSADQLTPKAIGAVLVPWPNRIRGGAYRFEDTELQLALTEPTKGNASHGLARWDRWTPMQHRPDSVTLGIDVVPQTGWPFELRAEVTYTLHPDSGLRVVATARNTGSRRLPFGMGFHPYLAVGAGALSAVEVRLAAKDRLLTDDAQIPVGRSSVTGTPYDLAAGRPLGELRLDDAFTGLARDAQGRAAVEVRASGAGGTTARVWMDDAFGFTQLFTIEQLVDGQDGLAVEPMTCPADAFNSGEGLLVLEPGASWQGSWGIEPG